MRCCMHGASKWLASLTIMLMQTLLCAVCRQHGNTQAAALAQAKLAAHWAPDSEAQQGLAGAAAAASEAAATAQGARRAAQLLAARLEAAAALVEDGSRGGCMRLVVPAGPCWGSDVSSQPSVERVL